MSESPFESERPPDEAWWERELNRNEKLIDKYMAVLGDDPDEWDKWEDPDDLYNKVHFNIDPPERAPKEKPKKLDDPAPAETDQESEEVLDGTEGNNVGDEAVIEDLDDDGELNDEDDNALEPEPVNDEDYPAIAKKARTFAVSVLRFEDIPQESEVLYLSAGKVGANLAGGNGLGYDDDSICGNIVKCRWALADCEFCREMLGHLHEKTGNAAFGELHQQAQELSAAIRDRIARLRARVWW